MISAPAAVHAELPRQLGPRGGVRVDLSPLLLGQGTFFEEDAVVDRDLAEIVYVGRRDDQFDALGR